MCRIGDIICIKRYITEDGIDIGSHSFVVIEDEKGRIGILEYDFIANVMSSLKNETQKQRRLHFIENMLITSQERVIERDNGKEAFIKADQLYYFDKSRIDYTVIGNVSDDILNALYELIELLDEKGLIKKNTRNLRNV